MRSSFAWSRSALVGILALLLPAPSTGQRLGIFFDAQAKACTTSLDPFGPCTHVYIVAFPDTAVALAGAQFRVELPPFVPICDHSITFPRLSGFTAAGSLTAGMDLQFFPCLDPGPAVELVHFDIYDHGSTHRNDLVLHLSGSSPDSLGQSTRPKLKVCDPANPEGNRGLLPAQVLDAHVNCTHDCDCTSALEPRTWGAVKKLFRDR
jgi:hypothetical protein